MTERYGDLLANLGVAVDITSGLLANKRGEYKKARVDQVVVTKDSIHINVSVEVHPAIEQININIGEVKQND